MPDDSNAQPGEAIDERQLLRELATENIALRKELGRFRTPPEEPPSHDRQAKRKPVRIRKHAAIRKNKPGASRFRGREGYYLDFIDPQDIRRSRWVGPSYRKAQKTLRGLRIRGELAASRQTAIPPPPMTLQQFAELYLEEKATRCRLSTVRADRNRLYNRILPKLGHILLRDLDTGVIAECLHDVRKRTSAATANRHRALLSHILTVAMQRDLIDKHPILRRIPAYEERPKARQTFSEPQQERLLAACREVDEGIKHPFLYDACLISLHTAARPGNEVLSLRWQDVDFEAGEHGKIRFHNTKSKRDVVRSMTASLAAALRERQAKLGGEWVFPSPRINGPRTTSSYKKPFRRALMLAGLPPDAVPYWMRHTVASRLAAMGVPLVVIRDKLGHRSIATTNIYAHSTDAAEEKTAELLGQIGEPPE